MVCGRELGLVNLHKLSTQWRPHLVKVTPSGQGDPIWSRRPHLVKETLSGQGDPIWLGGRERKVRWREREMGREAGEEELRLRERDGGGKSEREGLRELTMIDEY